MFELKYPKVKANIFFLPEKIVIQEAMELARNELLKQGFEDEPDDLPFRVRVSTKVLTNDVGGLVIARISGDLIELHPAPSPWTIQEVYQLLIDAVMGDY